MYLVLFIHQHFHFFCGCPEQIFNEGDNSTEMYFIIQGEVEVETFAGSSLGFLTEGAFFGETALIQAVTGKVDETWQRTRSVRYVIASPSPPLSVGTWLIGNNASSRQLYTERGAIACK
eukprot:COSAG02_NODE_1262_length_13556_cov_11.011522_2_plen_119_part_00